VPGEEEEQQQQTMYRLTFQYDKLSNQRNEMIKQTKNTCGTWPPTHEALVNEYIQLFVNFINP
jgi:hypothetical protein